MFHKEEEKIILVSVIFTVAVVIGVEFIFTTPWIIKVIQLLALVFLITKVVSEATV